MTETKHTPGPWSFEMQEFGAVIVSDGSSIATAFASKVISGAELPMEANARLIAAAPDLLEALKELVEAFDDDVMGHKRKEQAEIVIAQAEGRM